VKSEKERLVTVAQRGWLQQTSQAIIDFCHVTSEKLLKFILYLYRMSVQKVSVVAGLRCRKLRGRVKRHAMAFFWLGKH